VEKNIKSCIFSVKEAVFLFINVNNNSINAPMVAIKAILLGILDLYMPGFKKLPNTAKNLLICIINENMIEIHRGSGKK
jgi:hypothetical protein